MVYQNQSNQSQAQKRGPSPANSTPAAAKDGQQPPKRQNGSSKEKTPEASEHPTNKTPKQEPVAEDDSTKRKFTG